MSSHHIVKENQEPALLILDFQALHRGLLDQLLEWSPTIIVDEYSVDFLLSAEIKVDVVFSNKELPFLQAQTKLLSIDDSYLGTALSYLVSKSYPAVNILCTRIDPLLMNFASAINIVAYCDNKRHVFVQGHYEKWKPKGEKVYVNPRLINSQLGLIPIEADTFETKNDGFFRLEFNATDFVCIGEDI